MAETIWVQWRRAEKAHAIIGEMTSDKWGPRVLTRCGVVVAKHIVTEVQRGPNPCRRCLAALHE